MEKQDEPDRLAFGRSVILDEAEALKALGRGLGDAFERAVELILDAQGRLIVGGLGKSGHIGRKIAATFTSTGTPAAFLHLSEAIHGDLGIVKAGDVGLLISQSGETPELLPVMDMMRALGVPFIGVSANPASPLIEAAAAPLRLPQWQEVGPEAVAPTTSTTMTLALGDALAMTVMRARGFGRADFGKLHPGGALGSRLSPVEALMHKGEAVPLVPEETPMAEAVVEMTAKRLGLVGVVDGNGLLAGVITDGDLRRNLDRLATASAGEVMTRRPRTILPGTIVDDALPLFGLHKITALFVVDDLDRPKPLGLLHIHDLPRGRATG